MRTLLLLLVAPATVVAQAQADTSRTRSDSARLLEAVAVTAVRAHNDAPISARTLDSADIAQRFFGQDPPLLLQGTPSLTSYAETGNYWGYSYVRIRGIDQSRINLSIDGIPLNDPEDQVLYFTDFPDLMNSVRSVQVQRGVGTSAPGTASYGGSINFETVPVASARLATVELQGGSFGSARGSVEYGSGLLSNHVATYARVSALQSDGYRHHSGVDGRSAFLGAAWVGDRDVVKLTALAGLFSDTLAYIGASASELSTDRRFNPLRPDETDRFGEQLAALSYTRYLARSSSLSATAYRISAAGHYGCSSACGLSAGDLWDYHLDFVWYGATVAWTRDAARSRASIGVNANTYARDHYLYDRPDTAASTLYYFNTGHKGDASAFGKLSYDVGAVTLFGDVQARRAEFRYLPDAQAGIPSQSIAWTFLNPKAGATLHVSPSLSAYASYGLNTREPARIDLLAGLDNLDASTADSVGPFSRVRPEHVRDLESGVHYARGATSLNANVFLMSFHDEILPVGILIQGYTPLRTNVARSWRRGVETDVTVQPARAVTLGLTATAMRARIADYTDESTNTSYHDVTPLLTPSFTSGQHVGVALTRRLSVALDGMYSSRAQLTNTDDATLRLPSYYLANASAEWLRAPYRLSLHVNNLTNSQRYSNGNLGFDGLARYYVFPPINAFLMLEVGM